MRQAKMKFESDIDLKSMSDPKVFWSNIRSRLKTKTGVAPLLEDITDPNSIKFGDQDKAKILQKQFSNVFTLEPEDEVPKLPNRTNDATCEINITNEMVNEEISKIKINKSCGPDEIQPVMLKELVEYVSGPIALLLNKTIKEGVIPKDWKQANVIPIYKKGAKSQAENY